MADLNHDGSFIEWMNAEANWTWASGDLTACIFSPTLTMRTREEMQNYRSDHSTFQQQRHAINSNTTKLGGWSCLHKRYEQDIYITVRTNCVEARRAKNSHLHALWCMLSINTIINEWLDLVSIKTVHKSSQNSRIHFRQVTLLIDRLQSTVSTAIMNCSSNSSIRCVEDSHNRCLHNNNKESLHTST